MSSGAQERRRVEAGDVVFALFLIAYGVLSIVRIPVDFTDLCYLFSLEQGRWVTQEWVHPLYVPTLDLFRHVLALFGYGGRMLIPTELLNVVASTTAFIVLYRLARRFPGSSLAAAVTLGVAALCDGFWSATVRPTPYAPALLCQTLSLWCLVADRPVPPRRFALAGAFAALAMGFHASAMALGVAGVTCALFEPDPARTRRATAARVLAFGGTMLVVAIGCWAVFLAYRGIGPDYFEHQDFRATFEGIEQVPGSSIYTSGSAIAQISSYIETMRKQAGPLLGAAAVVLVLIVLLRLWRRERLTPGEQRLTIATAANCAAIGGFFLINNTHNGFNFAALTLLPVLLAVAMRDSWIAVAAFALLAVPRTHDATMNVLRSGLHGSNDSLLTEVRFLNQTLGPRDVLLTPGSPFPEMLYLSHLNLLEVTDSAATYPGTEVPVVHPGPALRARIAWWLANGGRVLYASGDQTTDFVGDAGGAEKEHQIFWRPETAAAERAPKMRALHKSLEAVGLDMSDELRSPRGERYARIALRESSAPTAPQPPAAPLSFSELRAAFLAGDGDADAARRVRSVEFLIALDTAVGGDPWLACDAMDLICQEQPCYQGKVLPCRTLEGCDRIGTADDGREEHVCGDSGGHGDDAGGICFWGPVADRKVVGDYLEQWVQRGRLEPLASWGLKVDRAAAEMTMEFPSGSVALKWRLLDTCEPGPIEIQPPNGLPAAVATDAQLHQLAANLPVPKVRPVKGHKQR